MRMHVVVRGRTKARQIRPVATTRANAMPTCSDGCVTRPR